VCELIDANKRKMLIDGMWYQNSRQKGKMKGGARVGSYRTA